MTRSQRRIHLMLWVTLTPLIGVLAAMAVLAGPGPAEIDPNAGAADAEASP